MKGLLIGFIVGGRIVRILLGGRGYFRGSYENHTAGKRRDSI
jgi:hypothetical protein